MARKSLREIDPDKFKERLNSESDRACAILGAALLDARLETVFRQHLLRCQQELLGSDRPLGSFSARIRMARALALIDEDAGADLDTIRAIRNDFAHSFDHELSFQDQSISGRCSNLRTAQAYMDGFDVAASRPHPNLTPYALRAMRDAFKPPRWRFQLAVDFLEQYLSDLTIGKPTYAGSDLLGEVKDLSAKVRIQVRAELTVGTPPSSGETPNSAD